MSRGVATPAPRRSAAAESASRPRPNPTAHAPAGEHAADGPGRMLPPATRDRMEASFGASTEGPDGARGAPAGAAAWTTRARIERRARSRPQPPPDGAGPAREAGEPAVAAVEPARPPFVATVTTGAGASSSAPAGRVEALARAPPTAASAAPSRAGRPGGPAAGRSTEVGPSAEPEAPAADVAVLGVLDLAPTPTVQTKLSVSVAGDPLEREADAVAARVTRGAAPRPPGAAGAPAGRVHRAAAPARAPPVAHARGPPAGPGHTLPRGVGAVIASPGPGRPLDATVRARIEPHVGVDLGGVVVRQGPDAASAAHALRARAFTSGGSIFLAAGSSPTDVALMAHEATHVAQQQSAPAARTTLMRQAEGEAEEGFFPDISVSDFIPDVVLEGVTSLVRAIPGYTLLTQITGFDPIAEEPVEVSREELIEELLTYGPFGAAVGPVLQAIDVLGDVFDVISEGLAANNLTTARLVRDIGAAWSEVSIDNSIAGNVAIVERYVDALLEDVANFVAGIADRVLEIVRSVAAEVAEPLLQTPEIKPYWDLARKVLHYDPLRDEPVDAPTVEILADFLRLRGEEDRLAQMQERGTLQETADWLDTQFDTFASLVGELGTLFSEAWAAIQPENLPDLLTNLASLAERAFGFVGRVAEFGATVLVEILELVKDSLLGWLSEHAHQIPGFHLLTVILEQNPFTGEVVPRTATNLIRGFITLMPGGEATYDQLAESGVIAQAAERIEGELARLGISVELITRTFLGVWDTLSLDDLLDPLGAFERVVELFGDPIARIVEFVGVVIEVVVELILRLMNFPSELVGSIIANAMQAIADIQRDPVGFLINMLEAVKAGFSAFFDNILGYLTQGLVDWLFRGLGQLGIRLPTDLSLSSILDLVLQVLGVTVETLWTKLGEHIGPERVQMIRGALDMLSGAWSFIQDVQQGGVGAIWRYLTDQLSSLWDTLLGMARDWIMTTIVQNVTAKLLSLLDPTGVMAVVNSFIAFFRAIQSAVEYLREILEIIDRYVQTFAQIAAGNIVPGAQMLEQGLAAAIPIAIGFLANQVGLGNVPEKIVEIIRQLRELIDQALDWLFAQAARLGSAALSALGLGGDEAEPAPPAETPIAAGTADALQIDESVGLADGAHRLQSVPDSGDLILRTDPVLLSSVPNTTLQALYQDYVQKAAAYTAAIAEFDDPQRAHELGGQAEVPRPRARLGKSAVDAAVTAIRMWVEANGVPPTDAPGLGDVRPYAMQQPRFANIPIWRLEAEHVIPNGYFNALLEGMRLRRIEHGDEYQQMSTILIYERAAEWKTSGSGADEGDATIIRRIKSWASRHFEELNAEDGGEVEEDAEFLVGRFTSLIEDVEGRTLRKIDEEQLPNGTLRGHPAGASLRDFFAPRVNDVRWRQQRLFIVTLDERLHEAVGAGRTGF